MKYRLQKLIRLDYGLFMWLLILPTNISIAVEHDYMDAHRVEKQISLETCLVGQFDVHTNTIIRTGESQAIGGKFLQGLELETPEKCQRLCCETGNCDVYVFEDKNDGYCYLFQCGSPKNFHCKFTRHPNYTSALITQYKSLPATTPRPIPHLYLMNMSTQEQELLNLKIKPENNVISSTFLPTVAGINENRLVAAKASEVRKLSCGRFEFPCHSGECIAVYNACNGIPQCVDGSDEGPECSSSTNTLKSNTNNLENSKSEILQPVPDYRHTLKQNQQGEIDISFSENRGASVSAPTVIHKFPTDAQSDIAAHINAQNARWPSQRQPWQIVSQRPSYSSTQDQTPHRHKIQNLLPVDEQIINVGSRISDSDSLLKSKDENNANYPEKNEDYTDYPRKSVENWKKASIPTENEMPTSTPSTKETTHSSIVEQYKMIEQHLDIKFTDHDGHSERPRGAVLSLTLGLLVTAVIILIGCRLRTVGRRGSRHGGKITYTPDEDFLVNGMYL